MATFLPTECLTAPASYLPRARRVERLPRDPQVPLPDALGGPGARLSPVSIPQCGTGDSGGKARLLETFNKEIARAPTKVDGRARPTSLKDSAAIGNSLAIALTAAASARRSTPANP